MAPNLRIFLRINERTGQLLVGLNALWSTQPKIWAGHGPTRLTLEHALLLKKTNKRGNPEEGGLRKG